MILQVSYFLCKDEGIQKRARRDYSGRRCVGRERFRYNNLPHAHGARRGAHNAATATMYRKAAGAFTHGRPKRAEERAGRGERARSRVSIRVLYERIERDASRRAACIKYSPHRASYERIDLKTRRPYRKVKILIPVDLDELQSRVKKDEPFISYSNSVWPFNFINFGLNLILFNKRENDRKNERKRTADNVRELLEVPN